MERLFIKKVINSIKLLMVRLFQYVDGNSPESFLSPLFTLNHSKCGFDRKLLFVINFCNIDYHNFRG